jgi:hypothetical protein
MHAVDATPPHDSRAVMTHIAEDNRDGAGEKKTLADGKIRGEG